jgi:hypothetical protein
MMCYGVCLLLVTYLEACLNLVMCLVARDLNQVSKVMLRNNCVFGNMFYSVDVFGSVFNYGDV